MFSLVAPRTLRPKTHKEVLHKCRRGHYNAMFPIDHVSQPLGTFLNPCLHRSLVPGRNKLWPLRMCFLRLFSFLTDNTHLHSTAEGQAERTERGQRKNCHEQRCPGV